MPKPTNWNIIDMPHGSIKFNRNIGTEEEPSFVPIQIKLDVTARTSDGLGKTQVSKIKNIGTPQSTPFSTDTPQGRRDLHGALPSWVGDMLKEAVQDILEEDPSV